MSSGAFFVLLLPALFTAFGAYIMPDHLGNAPRGALGLTQKGIETVADFEGDAGALFDLTRDSGFNYSALNGVRDQLVGPFTLMVGELDARTSQAVIAAHFDNGGWIICRVNVGEGRATYLSYCADASRPYTLGFGSLITGESLPENCFGCLPAVDAEWQTWLQDRADRFNGAPQFERIVQQGNAVWMRAFASDGYAIDCLFTGITDVQLQECKEAIE